MRRQLKILVLLLIIILSNNAYSKDKSQKHFIWEVKSDKSTVFLLGSIHLAKESLYPLPKVIEDAYEKSDNVVVEIDINHVNPFELLKKSMYTDSSTLEMNISKAAFEKLKEKFEKKNIKKETYNKFKPWFAIINLMTLELTANGYNAELGIDKHFLDKATKDNKKVLELESLDFQMKLFEDCLNEFKDAFVDYSLNDFDETVNQVEKLFESWLKGDTKAFEKVTMAEIKDNPEYEPIMKKLINDRNINMAEKVKGYLEAGGTYIVIAGAGHLVGTDGILELLKKTGKYKIRQL